MSFVLYSVPWHELHKQNSKLHVVTIMCSLSWESHGCLLYTSVIAGLPTSNNTTVDTLQVIMILLTAHHGPVAGTTTRLCQNCFTKWGIKGIKIKETNSVQATFTTKRIICPNVIVNSMEIWVHTKINI